MKLGLYVPRSPNPSCERPTASSGVSSVEVHRPRLNRRGLCSFEPVIAWRDGNHAHRDVRLRKSHGRPCNGFMMIPLHSKPSCVTNMKAALWNLIFFCVRNRHVETFARPRSHYPTKPRIARHAFTKGGVSGTALLLRSLALRRAALCLASVPAFVPAPASQSRAFTGSAAQPRA